MTLESGMLPSSERTASAATKPEDQKQKTMTSDALTGAIRRHIKSAIEQESLLDGQSIDFTIEQLDLRIALSACSTPLEIEPYHQRNKTFSGRMTLQVTCQTPKPWRLFVPINFKRMDRVVTTAQPLPRRTALNESMLTYKTQDVSRLSNGYFRDKSALKGFETKYFIQQGHILSAHQLIPPTLIRRQQEVTIVSRSQNVSVKAAGIALSDGKKGDRIKVRNKKSQRIIEVKVGEDGIVYAPL
jgi:flagella basal body P-ring formation protein FlgA